MKSLVIFLTAPNIFLTAPKRNGLRPDFSYTITENQYQNHSTKKRGKSEHGG